MLSIQQIDSKDYPNGKQVVYQYSSQCYYDVERKVTDDGWRFTLTKKTFAEPFEKHLVEEIFEDYKLDAEVYVALVGEEEAGIMALQHMTWNNTLQIHNLYVEPNFKRQGIGTALMDVARDRAQQLGTRMITLETQTSNVPAIQFYLKNGFQLIGLNLCSYSNEDVAKGEVRVEMGLMVGNL